MLRSPAIASRALISFAKHADSALVELVGVNGEQARLRAAQGFDMISIATDVDVLAQGFAAHMTSASGSNVSVGTGYSAGKD